MRFIKQKSDDTLYSWKWQFFSCFISKSWEMALVPNLIVRSEKGKGKAWTDSSWKGAGSWCLRLKIDIRSQKWEKAMANRIEK